MTDSLPMIDSILYSQEKSRWKKLDDTDELVKLHRKFWIQGDYDKVLNVEGTTEVDAGAADGDIGPECHVLDSGIPDERSKFWVRKEYIRLYKRCEDHFKPDPYMFSTPALIVTGQPGIGKFFTCNIVVTEIYWLKGKRYWIRYVLCRRLACKEPVMWYRGKMLYLFMEDGVYLASADHSPISIRTRVWTLVDVDKGERVPEILAVRDTKHMIIFATPP